MRRIARLEFHDEKQLRHSTLGRRIVIGTVAFSIAFGGSVALAGSAAADGTGTISGIANDAYGSALPGATVSVFGDSDTDLVTTATTKSDGTYTTAEIPDGTYRVKFSAAARSMTGIKTRPTTRMRRMSSSPTPRRPTSTVISD